MIETFKYNFKLIKNIDDRKIDFVTYSTSKIYIFFNKVAKSIINKYDKYIEIFKKDLLSTLEKYKSKSKNKFLLGKNNINFFEYHNKKEKIDLNKTNEINEVIKRNNNNKTSEVYANKYLKYKNKYLELKKNM